MAFNKISAALTLAAVTTLAPACSSQTSPRCPQIDSPEASQNRLASIQQSTKNDVKAAEENVDKYGLTSLIQFIDAQNALPHGAGEAFEWTDFDEIQASFHFRGDEIFITLTSSKKLDADFCRDLALKLFRMEKLKIPVRLNISEMEDSISSVQNPIFTELMIVVSGKGLLLVYNGFVILNTHAPQEKDEKYDEPLMTRITVTDREEIYSSM